MFPSSGLFARVSCPLSHRGTCERPHCFYKHDAVPQEKFGASIRAAVRSAGVHNRLYAACEAPVNVETKDDSFHELERINKEIETVRHEVEQERRRLSCYQTVQPNATNRAHTSTCGPEGKTAGRGSAEQSSRASLNKAQAQPRKYVVDNSKPTTDLEYDPLSNFSADLLCCNSKEPKVKNHSGSKRAASAAAALTQEEPLVCESPDPRDDDDCVLIIDVPLSPDEAGDGHSAGNDPLRDAAGHMKGGEPELSPREALAKSETLTDSKAHDVETSREQPASNDNREREGAAADGNVIDLTGCLEALQSECERISVLHSAGAVKGKLPEPPRLSEKLDQRDDNQRNDRSNWQSGAGKKIPSKNSLYLDASPKSPLKRRDEQAEAQEKPRTPRQDGAQSQKMSGKVSGQTQRHAGLARTSSAAVQEEETAASGSGSQPRQASTSASTIFPDCGESSETAEQTSVAKKEVICISSEDEEESCHDSEIDLSDSDPMEECYRIFMEANNEEKANKNHPEDSMGAVAEVKPEVARPAVAGKKRLAHEAAHPEQPAAKSRPQPQVLIPFRGPAAPGFASQALLAAKIQQAQRRGAMLNAAVKCGQTFVSSINKKIPESPRATSAPTPALQTAPAQNACSSYLPVGGTVIAMGDNLHLIVPEGAFPLSVPFSSSPVTSVLTPIGQPAAVTAVHRGRPAAPLVISALARKPVTSSGSALPVCPSPAPSANPQAAAKSVPVKRKLKQQQKAAKDKVPHDVRQRYVDMFTEEFFKTTPDLNEAFEKALAEEKTVYNRSINKVKYQSVAVNALKRLRNQRASASQSKGKKEVNSQRLRGNIPLNPEKLEGKDNAALYECLKDYILSDDRLIENNYPIRHPEKPGSAVLFTANKKVNADPLMRICCRCGATYSVNQSGKHVRKEECTYHYGRGVTKRVPGGVETRYSCCEGVMGAPGCQVFQLHVHDFLSLDGFVSTRPRCSSDTSSPGVFSLDCGMCYAVSGLELSRVTVINSDLQVVYDTFVRPSSEVIDYNTRFSGISEDDVKGNHTSIKEVQETLLSFISADTILIGHGLETALCLLKLIHGMVVDTSVVFPHRLGPPNKLTLNKLTTEHLRRIIQQSVCGHDTAEDAAACMELMLWKAKEDGKLRK